MVIVSMHTLILLHDISGYLARWTNLGVDRLREDQVRHLLSLSQLQVSFGIF